MITPVLAAVSPLILYSVTTMFVFVCLLLIGVILIQKPKGGGLSGAFGGGASSAQSAFGARTGDFLTWFTVGAFVVFLVLGITLTLISRPDRGPRPSASSSVPVSAPIPSTTQPSGTASGAGSTPATQPSNSNGENKR